MKTNAIIRILVYSLIILILIGIMGGFIADEIYLSGGLLQKTDTPVPTESLAEINQQDFTEQIQNIEIEWVAGNITIHKSKSLNSIIVEEYSPVGSEYPIICRQSGQTLKIQFCEESMKFPSFGINAEVSKDLVIRVPASWNCNNLEIDTAATDVTIQDLSINDLDFDGASGKLTLENCDVNVLDIDTASGDVEFSGTLEELDFDAASARFNGEFYQIPKKLNLDAMSGDLTVVLPEHSGFYLELDAMSGSFDSDFDFHTTGAHYECGDGSCQIKISALSGDVSILKSLPAPAENCDH